MSAPRLTEPPRHHLKHIQIEALEAAVYGRRHEEASAALMEAFRRLRTGAEFVGMAAHDEPSRTPYFSRLAAAICALLVDPQFAPSDEGYARLLIEHGMIDAVFEVSAFGSSDHLARVLADDPLEANPGKLTYSADNLAKWLILHGLGSRIDIDHDELLSKPGVAAMLFPLWAATLGQSVVLTELAHNRREKLLRLAHYFDRMEAVPDVAVAPLSDAYMHASYCTAPDKHEVKWHISNLLARTLNEKLKAILPTAAELAARRAVFTAGTDKRPTMVVPLEHFGSFHAMYRCYAPIMRQLKKRFRLVAVARPSALDETSRATFHDVIPLPEGHLTFSTIVEAINKAMPDILYYPSVGMALQWVGLSCVRLAPIQVMTLGHPATSMSPAMDYVVAEDVVISDAYLFSERVLTVPDGSMAFERRQDLPPCTVGQGREFDRLFVNGVVVNVAVSAMVLKLNHPFLQTLGRIAARALDDHETVVRYHFFPAQLGVTHWQAKKHLRAMFPNCEVHPRADYTHYMQWLAACDVSLCPFPFGGTNSSVDSLWCGLPTVMLMGEQPHSRSDAQVLTRAKVPLIAQSVDDYEDMAVRLITRPAERSAFHEQLRKVDLEQAFFAEDKSEAYGRAFERIVREHEALQQIPAGELIAYREEPARGDQATNPHINQGDAAHAD